jgi:hypothetical protein
MANLSIEELTKLLAENPELKSQLLSSIGPKAGDKPKALLLSEEVRLYLLLRCRFVQDKKKYPHIRTHDVTAEYLVKGHDAKTGKKLNAERAKFMVL